METNGEKNNKDGRERKMWRKFNPFHAFKTGLNTGLKKLFGINMDNDKGSCLMIVDVIKDLVNFICYSVSLKKEIKNLFINIMIKYYDFFFFYEYYITDKEKLIVTLEGEFFALMFS